MNRTRPSLAEGEQEHICIFHDKSAFHANEYQANYWLSAGKQVTIYPTSHVRGNEYWNMDQMINQVKHAIRIAHQLLPGAVIHWIFNNSSCHASLVNDALTVTKMNFNSGGKNILHMHDMIVLADNLHGL
ncbi:hypothetical protein WOLCODRAFT_78449 [Wolfiporia cocos MD-104 SS10]|uniref:Uncharacterized protein n=1 Tax=Wolfiporia cocos (strain MD-104) TaxID=742152 RepID=A0A2H3IZM5_WOLCO|nr:hypothetical protein WOLCODRAFT_78449 [Wolfiporia cocos MD-104 SS10]